MLDKTNHLFCLTIFSLKILYPLAILMYQTYYEIGQNETVMAEKDSCIS